MDISADGKRFLVLMPAESPGTAEGLNIQVIFLQNFFDDVRRLAPDGN